MAAKKTAQPKTPTTTTPAKTANLAAPPKAARAAKAAMPATLAAPPKAAKAAAPTNAAPPTKAAPPTQPSSRRAAVSAPPNGSASAPPAVVPPVAAAPERPRATVTHEDIRVRAYYLALEHGGKGGNLDFWLLAERELRTRATTGD